MKDGDTVITPETITTYTRDAAGRTLSVRKEVGPMSAIKSTEYDLLGRVTKRTDVLGRETQTSYSEDGLTTTVTQPNGATLITTRNADGSVAHVSGTGQREFYHVYDISGSAAQSMAPTLWECDTLGNRCDEELYHGAGLLRGIGGRWHLCRHYTVSGTVITMVQKGSFRNFLPRRKTKRCLSTKEA